jgi:hypothetical protein
VNNKSEEIDPIQSVSRDSMREPPIGYLETLEKIFSSSKDSMQKPSAEAQILIDEMLASDPRLAYPYMSKSEYRKMMAEREKK